MSEDVLVEAYEKNKISFYYQKNIQLLRQMTPEVSICKQQ